MVISNLQSGNGRPKRVIVPPSRFEDEVFVQSTNTGSTKGRWCDQGTFIDGQEDHPLVGGRLVHSGEYAEFADFLDANSLNVSCVVDIGVVRNTVENDQISETSVESPESQTSNSVEVVVDTSTREGRDQLASLVSLAGSVCYVQNTDESTVSDVSSSAGDSLFGSVSDYDSAEYTDYDPSESDESNSEYESDEDWSQCSLSIGNESSLETSDSE